MRCADRGIIDFTVVLESNIKIIKGKIPNYKLLLLKE